MWITRTAFKKLQERLDDLEAAHSELGPNARAFYKAHPEFRTSSKLQYLKREVVRLEERLVSDCTGALTALRDRVQALEASVKSQDARIGTEPYTFGDMLWGARLGSSRPSALKRIGDAEDLLCKILHHFKLRVAGPTPGGQLVKATKKAT
ncbi:MAG: hypothetical protein Q7R68_11145 [Nitrospirales bacterium]|nr:hypothetical protein [Nitrospirales bacterium]